jgi:hypothetical protein
MASTIQHYKQERDLYSENPESYTANKAAFEELKGNSPRPLLPGFFLSNKTDYELRKTIRMEEKHHLSELKAVIVDYAKGKWCTLEVKSPFTAADHLQVLTQENKLTPLEPLILSDLAGIPLTSASPQCQTLVKVKWQKGMQPKALIY